MRMNMDDDDDMLITRMIWQAAAWVCPPLCLCPQMPRTLETGLIIVIIIVIKSFFFIAYHFKIQSSSNIITKMIKIRFAGVMGSLMITIAYFTELLAYQVSSPTIQIFKFPNIHPLFSSSSVHTCCLFLSFVCEGFVMIFIITGAPVSPLHPGFCRWFLQFVKYLNSGLNWFLLQEGEKGQVGVGGLASAPNYIVTTSKHTQWEILSSKANLVRNPLI